MPDYLKYTLIAAGAVILAFAAFVILYALFLFICSLFVDMSKEYEKPSKLHRKVIQLSMFLLMHLGNVHIHPEGLEKLPEDTPFLLVSNHRSAFDPLTGLAVLGKTGIIYVSKPENFKIPIVGRFIHSCCFLPIDRENPRNAVVTIKKTAALIKSLNVPACIYPEGTRTKTGELLPFHNAVFKIAQEANVPVAVMVTDNTEKVIKNMPFRRTDIMFRIVDVIPAEKIKASRTNIIGEEVREMMEKALSEVA